LDLPDAADRLVLLHELCSLDFEEYPISALSGTGLEELRGAIYRALDVVRVYTKLPAAKTADFERPFTLRRGGTLLELAELVHRDFVEQFKFAKVWTDGTHDATVAKGDYVLQDKDVVELHV
ncbi:MAG TPA: TGS domain-containing protein, partial [Pirellulales bacterium]|nr:TGS domain-containing protein [Pirellulales bacterium]